MVIEKNTNEIVVRIPVSPQTTKRVQDMLDYLRHVELTSNFETPQEQVDVLAREVNNEWRKERNEAFERLMNFQRAELPSDFDYKKELTEAIDERFNRAG